MSSKDQRYPDRADGRLLRQSSQYKTNVHDSDDSKLSAQRSHRNVRLPDRDGSTHNDSGKLFRTSTFHHRPSHGSSSLSRRPSTYQPPSDSASSSRLSRKSSLRHVRHEDQGRVDNEKPSSSVNGGHFSESERKERKRRQNTESARRTRERKRVEMEKMEKVYDANELRIKELELMADELSRELRRHNTISDPRRDGSSVQNREDRPKWFGAPF